METNKTNYTTIENSNTIKVERVFNAPLDIVWQAWTDAAILSEWWAPKPWKAVTSKMDFKEGGAWFYAMIGPNGEKHWSKAEFTKIIPQKLFKGKDYFTDEKENKIADMPATEWTVEFEAKGETTKVTSTLVCESRAAMDKLISMGFKEGFASAHENLDAWLDKAKVK